MKFSKQLFIFSFLCLIYSQASAQAYYTKGYYQFPMHAGQQNYLSGTMGELRPNHFHSGIDIKTGGVEGWPIHSIADGYVSRIKVSPYGYGWALYVQHPNGHTSVYAHCQKFRSDIAEYVLSNQYSRQTFALELFPEKGQFQLKKGDIIAYSGNSGSSFGPHLHFEIRDAAQHPLNPLLFDFSEVKDKTKPYIYKYALTTLSADARINNRYQSKDYDPIERSRGTYSGANPIPVYGDLGLAIKANDLLDGVSNRNGVMGIEVKLDGKVLFTYENEHFSFAQTRYLNAHIEYEKYALGQGRFHRCYLSDGNPLNLYPELNNRGIITIRDTLKHDLEVRTWDAYKNESTLQLELQGTLPEQGVFNKYATESKKEVKQEVIENLLKLTLHNNPAMDSATVYYDRYSRQITPAYFTFTGMVYLWDLRKGLPTKIDFGDTVINFNFTQTVPSNGSFTLYHDLATVYFPKKALYDTLYLEMYRQADVLTIGSAKTPLHKNISINMKVPGAISNKSKTHVYYLNGEEEPEFIGGTWDGNRIKFNTRDFGQYTLIADTTAPTVNYLGKSGSKLRFKAKDDISGLATYKAYLNGEWVLLHYRYQEGLLWTELKDKSKDLSGEIDIVLTDNAGNRSFYSHKL